VEWEKRAVDSVLRQAYIDYVDVELQHSEVKRVSPDVVHIALHRFSEEGRLFGQQVRDRIAQNIGASKASAIDRFMSIIDVFHGLGSYEGDIELRMVNGVFQVKAELAGANGGRITNVGVIPELPLRYEVFWNAAKQ